MPIDSSLYAQFAPKVQSPLDVQNGLAQQAQSQLGLQHTRMALQQQQSDLADSEALKAAYRGGADPTTPEGRAAIIKAAPLQAPKILQAGAEYDKTKAQTGEANAKAAEANAKAAQSKIEQNAGKLFGVTTPDAAHAWIDQAMQRGDITAQDAAAEHANVPSDPSQLPQWKNGKMMEAVKVHDLLTLQQKQAADAETARYHRDETQTQRDNAQLQARTHLAGIDIQQKGENTRAAAARETQLAVAGVSADGTLSEDQRALVDAIGQYKVQPPTGMALRNPRMQTILAQVAQKYPDFDATQYGARQVAAKSFATGKDGQAVQSANTALNHLETISQLAAAQKNGDIRLFNQIANRFATETGGTAPTNLQAAITMVGPEISKAVIGAGGGQGDREKVDAALAALVKGGPAQAAGTVATMQDLFGGRLTEAERTYKRTTGREDFADSFLSPAAQKILASKKGASAGNSDLHDKAQAIIRGGK